MAGGAGCGGHRLIKSQPILTGREIGDHIMSRLTAKFKAVGADAAFKRVVAAIALEPVIARPTGDPIVTLTAKQAVVTAVAENMVIGLVAIDRSPA